MTIDEINQRAFYFASSLEESNPPIFHSQNVNRRSSDDSSSHLQVISLGEIKNLTRIETDPNTMEKRISSMGVDGKVYLFHSAQRAEFNAFLESIMEYPTFTNHTTTSYLEKKVYEWLIRARKTSINQNLYDHLSSTLTEDTKSYTFQFPVINLHIPHFFQIGNVRFEYYREGEFGDIYDTIRDENTKVTREEYIHLFSKYSGIVFGTFTIKAEYSKAKELAYLNCCEAVDILKIFSHTLYYPKYKCIVDLEKRLNRNFDSNFLSYEGNSKNLHMSLEANSQPWEMDNNYLQRFTTLIKPFSDLLLITNKNSLQLLIVQNISFLAHALATDDLHLRVTFLISIAESLLLEEGHVNGITLKTKRRFANLLHGSNTPQYDQFLNAINDIYQVRHSKIHKGLRLTINMDNLKLIQQNLVELLIKLVGLSQTISTKQDVINFAEQTSSN